MNIPQAFEGAIAETIRAHADLPDLPRMRTWQTLDGDFAWTPNGDRVFPLVDIRATPPSVGDDGVTLQSTVNILVATDANDDQSHAQIAMYYAAVQGVIDSLYAQFRANSPAAERNTFDAFISDRYPAVAANVAIGGFEWGEPLAPYEEGGANFIGMVFVIHYSRVDY